MKKLFLKHLVFVSVYTFIACILSFPISYLFVNTEENLGDYWSTYRNCVQMLLIILLFERDLIQKVHSRNHLN